MTSVGIIGWGSLGKRLSQLLIKNGYIINVSEAIGEVND